VLEENMDINKILSMSDEERSKEYGVSLEQLLKDREEYIQECQLKIKYLLGAIEIYESKYEQTRFTTWTSAFLDVHTQICVLLAQEVSENLEEQSKFLDEMHEAAQNLMSSSFEEYKKDLWKVKS
jgi:hypothetical protein